MIDNEGYKYLYSYGMHINYCLPIKGNPVLYVSKYNYEECNGAYVYNNEECSITDYDLDNVSYKQSVPQFLFVEYITLYDELEDEGDINFIEEGKRIFKEIIGEVIATFDARVEELEEYLKEASTEDDKKYILGSIGFTKQVIRNIKRIENLEPVIKV